MADTAQVARIPFEIASQYSNRASIQIPTFALDASAPKQITPQQIPAVGYIYGLLMEVTIDGTGGTTPAFTADAPFNVIQSMTFRNAAGVNLISSQTGYDYYLMNKWGGQVNPGFGPWADPRFGEYDATAPDAHFFLWVPVGIDPTTGYGSIPALASNASYQLDIVAAAQATILSSNPTVNVSINVDAFYFDLPAATDSVGTLQETTPQGNGTTSLWLKETPTISPGTQLVQSVNVGNVIRNHILVVRNSAGARIETNGLPNLLELYVDNDPRFSLRKSVHKNLMRRWYGLSNPTYDAAGGLDTGVLVFPYHALLNGIGGSFDNTRAQLLPTLNATLLQFRAQDFGSAVSRLDILTEVISTADPVTLFGK